MQVTRTGLAIRAALCLLLLAAGPAGWVRGGAASQDRSPKEWIERAIAAHGGKEGVERTEGDQVQEGDAEILQPIRNRVQMTSWRKGDRTLVVAKIAGLEAKIYVDPRGGWKQVLGVVSDLSPDELGDERQGREHSILELLRVGRPGYTVSSLGRKPLPDGAAAEAVRATPPKGTPTDFYFDPASDLVAAIGYRGRNFFRGVETDQLLRFLDYRKVDGVPVSFLQKKYDDGQLAQTVTVTRFEMKTEIPDSIFERPGAAGSPGVQPWDGQAVTVPLEFQSGELVVSASLNGGPPRRFLLDTGAAITILLPTVAEGLGLKYTGDLNAGGGGGLAAAKVGRLESLSVGSATAKGLDVGVLGLGPLEALIGGNVGGILGSNFLSQYQVTIDYGRRRLTLAPRSAPLPPGRATRMEISQGIPSVDAQLGTRKFRMAIDTGATMVVLPSRLGATLKPKRVREMAAMGADLTPMKLRATRLPSLTVAGHTVRDVVVAFARPGAVAGSLVSDFSAGFLGNTLLRRFRVTLDYGKQQAVFVPDPKGAGTDEWIQPGVELEPRPPDQAAIVRIHTGSPAARAGLKVDDRVVAVNGRPVKGLSGDQLAALLQGPEKSQVRLTIRRGGKLRTVTLRRERLL